MTKPIKSRHGLTRCRACRAHIQAADTPSATVCPFCGANLHAGASRISLPSGRGGILAASLLAFSAAGCGGGQAQVEDDQTVSSDNTNDAPPDTANDQYDPQPADDNAAVAEYGVSPDAFEDDTADDPRPTPRYGLPPSRR